MNANEASLEAARLWLAGATAAGVSVVVVGSQVYCGANGPHAKYAKLLATLDEHKSALVALAAAEDEETRFRRARSMFPGPEALEGK